MKTIYDILQERVKALDENRKIKYTGKGDVSLAVRINEDSEYLSSYCSNVGSVASPDIIEFIDTSSMAVRGYNIAALDVYSDCLEEEDQQRLKTGIKNAYDLKAVENNRQRRQNKAAVAVFTILGVAILAASIWCYNGETVPELLCYIIDTVGCVLLWTALDACIFEGTEFRLEEKRLKQLRSMEVRFHKVS